MTDSIVIEYFPTLTFLPTYSDWLWLDVRASNSLRITLNAFHWSTIERKKNPNVYLLHWNGHVCACSCSCINRVKKIECLYCTTPVPHQYQAMYLLTKYSLKYFLVEWSEYKSESPISWFVASQVGLVQENRRLKKYKSDVSRSWFDWVKYLQNVWKRDQN